MLKEPERPTEDLRGDAAGADAGGADGSAECTVSQEQEEDKFYGKMLLKWSHKIGEKKDSKGSQSHTEREMKPKMYS